MSLPYLVLSHGEFKQADRDWFSPGIGGSLYNPPGIKHAEPQIVSILEAARAKDHRVGVTVAEIAAGRRGGI
ncbi:MAG: hypothetical protein EOS10_00885 [Mesorhizobium sp.]|nr:MAG: hypothetical protein EOS10_00885 [Mesorhizobium sp.]